MLKVNHIRISMDGKGRWLDNVFIERLRRSVKYEHVSLHAYESVSEAKQQLASYFLDCTPEFRQSMLEYPARSHALGRGEKGSCHEAKTAQP